MRSVVFAALLLCLLIASSANAESLREILTEGGVSRFVDVNELHSLRTQHGPAVGFFDVTDVPNFPRTPVALSADTVFPDQPKQKQYVRSLLPKIDINRITATITQLSSLRTRYYTTDDGIATPDWLAAQYSQIIQELGPGYSGIVNVTTLQTSSKQKNVVVTLSSPETLQNEGANARIIVLGSHLDSYNFGATNPAPGADDDASGCATVLEAFRVLYSNNYVPERGTAVQFMHFAMEEVGLVGSQILASSYKDAGAKVASMLQMDMTGYSEYNNVAIITDYTSANLNTFLRKLVDAYLDIEWQDTQCGYACSDHASFFQVGYDAAFSFEAAPFGKASNPYIHTTSDTLDKLSRSHMLELAKLAVGYMVEMGGAPSMD